MTGAQIIIIIAIVGLLGYSACAASKGKVTISQQLRDWSLKWTCLPFCAGVLATHWFMPLDKTLGLGWMVLLPVILLLLVWDIVWNQKQRERVLYRYPGVWLVMGGVFGLLWAQGF